MKAELDLAAQTPALMGIGDAAALLGVSRTTVQKMVDSGALQALRTSGGHRRILRQSLESHLTERAPARRSSEGRQLQVLVADDNALVRQAFEQQIKRCGLPVQLHFCVDAVDALLQIERRRPHVIITDLRMEPFDGFHLLRVLRQQPAFASQWVVVTSALSEDEIQEKGGLPPSVCFYPKPMQWDRLCGFLEACCQRELGIVNRPEIMHALPEGIPQAAAQNRSTSVWSAAPV